MSTPNGYRLADDIDLFAFFSHVHAALEPLRERADVEMLLPPTIAIYDTISILGVESAAAEDLMPDSMPRSAWTSAYFRFVRKGSLYPPIDDDPNYFETLIGIDPHTGRHYAKVHTLRPEMKDRWEQMPDVEPFPYTDEFTDPLRVVDGEVEERLQVWQRVLPPEESTYSRTLRFHLRPPNDVSAALVRDREGAAARLIGEVLTEFDDPQRRSRDLAVRLVIAAEPIASVIREAPERHGEAWQAIASHETVEEMAGRIESELREIDAEALLGPLPGGPRSATTARWLTEQADTVAADVTSRPRLIHTDQR